MRISDWSSDVCSSDLSPFRDAVNKNREFLLSLDPDRLLHNFREGAGLTPRAPVYGGWEARGIAGHSLGHYLSACALMHAQTGDAAVRDRITHIVRSAERRVGNECGSTG